MRRRTATKYSLIIGVVLLLAGFGCILYKKGITILGVTVDYAYPYRDIGIAVLLIGIVILGLGIALYYES